MRARRTFPGRIRRSFGLLVVALSAIGLGVPSASAVADEAAWMYDPGNVVEIDFGGLSQSELDALEAEPDEYQPGTFEVRLGGVSMGPPLGEVGIRLKGGAGSFRPLSEKAAFKVKVNEYSKQTFFGLKKLTFNNMVQDPSMLHETLTYELFRSLGVPAPRTGFAFIRVNGEPYGVYLNVETYDKISLANWFATTQHLYEADAPGLDLAPGKAEEFEVDEGDDEDFADLEGLIAAANDEVGDWSEGMAGIADLDEMTRMWSVERYVGHWDGYAGVADDFRPNNYYVHSDDANLFSMLPWGTDQTWGVSVEFDEEAGGRLFNKCIADASCEAEYLAGLGEVQAKIGDLHFDAQAEEIVQLLAPCQALEVEPRREYEVEEVVEGVDALHDFIGARPGELATFLGNSEPVVVEPPPGATGEEPCSLKMHGDPKPGTGGDFPPSPPRLIVDRKMRIGPSHLVRGVFVVTRLSVLGAGRATQKVTSRLDGSRRTVCTDQVQSKGAGSLTVRCRISGAALRCASWSPARLC